MALSKDVYFPKIHFRVKYHQTSQSPHEFEISVAYEQVRNKFIYSDKWSSLENKPNSMTTYDNFFLCLNGVIVFSTLDNVFYICLAVSKTHQLIRWSVSRHWIIGLHFCVFGPFYFCYGKSWNNGSLVFKMKKMWCWNSKMLVTRFNRKVKMMV